VATLERAIEIAVEAHKGQKDKAGAPYILHALRVMHSFDTEKEMTVAILHDVVEKSSWTFGQLRDEGFSAEILEAVKKVTRGEAETYEEFLQRNKTNPVARRVRITDIEDKLDFRRIKDLSEEHLRRLSRYHRAWRVLSEAD